MGVPVPVPGVAEKEVEPALRGKRRPLLRPSLRRRRIPLAGAALQSPFADCRRRVTRAAQHRGERVVILQRLVELVIPHVRVALMHAGEQRRAGRRADRRRAVVLRQAHPFRRHRIEPRRRVPRLAACGPGPPLVLEKHPHVAEAKVVREDEDNVRPGGRPRPWRSAQREEQPGGKRGQTRCGGEKSFRQARGAQCVHGFARWLSRRPAASLARFAGGLLHRLASLPVDFAQIVGKLCRPRRLPPSPRAA